MNDSLKLWGLGVCFLVFGCGPTEEGAESLQKEPAVNCELDSAVSEFHLSFDLAGSNNSTTIVLERYFWNAFLAVDSIRPNVLGNAETIINDVSNGLFRVSVNDGKPIYFILNRTSDHSITISGTLSEFVGGLGKLSPDHESSALAVVTKLFENHQTQLEAWKDSLSSVSKVNPKYYSLKNRFRKELELEKLTFYQDLDAVRSEQPCSYVSSVVISALIKPNRYDGMVDSNAFELEPALLHESFFDNMDLNNLDNLGHPIFWQSINQYVKEFAGESESDHLDAMDILFAKVNSEEVNRLLASHLVDHYAKEGRETIASYIAQNHSNGCSVSELDSMIRFYAEIPTLNAGDTSPSFKLTDEGGEDIEFRSYVSGSPLTLIYFWKSTCKECERQHEKIIQLLNDHKDSDFQVLGISIDKELESFESILNSTSFNYPNVCIAEDASSFHTDASLVEFGIRKTPTLFLVDRNGMIIGKDLFGTSLNNAVSGYLAAYEKHD